MLTNLRGRLKTSFLEDKENVKSNKNEKPIEHIDVKRKKGLSVGAENQRSNVAATKETHKLATASKHQFKVYNENYDENKRSRRSVKSLYENAKEENAKKSPVCAKVKQKTTHLLASDIADRYSRNKFPSEEKKNFKQRTRSLSNVRCSYSSENKTFTVKRKRRTFSEEERSKIKHISEDVEIRTLHSIQTWIKTMRNARIDKTPKYLYSSSKNVHSSIRSAGISVNRTLAKSNQENMNSTRVSFQIPRHELNLSQSDSLNNDTSSNQMADTNDHVSNEEQSYMKNEHSIEEKCFDESDRKEEEEEEEKYYFIDLLYTEREREKHSPKLSFNFLRKNINAQQRRILVANIIYLGVHCNYESYVVYQTIKLFDIAIDTIEISIERAQLLLLACLWIILKKELSSGKVPSATSMLKLAKDEYINEEKLLLEYERKILSTVQFNLRFADPFSLITYYISISHAVDYLSNNDIMRIYYCSNYLIDLAMLDENLCNTSIFVLAITAFEMSWNFVFTSAKIDETRVHSRSRETLAIWEEQEAVYVKQRMIKWTLQSDKDESRIIYKKYRRSKYCRISDFLLENVKRIVERS